jgi:general stress protein YciG
VKYLIELKVRVTYDCNMAKQEQAIATKAKGAGKGWHGDPSGHAAAGRKGGMKSSGNFRNNPERAAAAGRVGGRMSPGNFKNDPERARKAGRKGGSR